MASPPEIEFITHMRDFPSINPTEASIPVEPIECIRAGVLELVEAKLVEEVYGIITTMGLHPGNNNIYTAVRAFIDPLPPETDFDVPSLLTLVGPSIPLSMLSKFHPQDPEENAPSIYEVFMAKYQDLVTPDLLTFLHQPKSFILRTLLRQPARNPLRHNHRYATARKEFNAQRRGNVHAALLQISGVCMSHNSRCQNCVDGRGFWDTCVVASRDVSYDFSGSCANCYYNGKGNSCTFFRSKCSVHHRWRFRLKPITTIRTR